jgi:hypothetical protein
MALIGRRLPGRDVDSDLDGSADPVAPPASAEQDDNEGSEPEPALEPAPSP